MRVSGVTKYRFAAPRTLLFSPRMQGTTSTQFSAAGAGGVLLAVLVALRRHRRPHRLGCRLRRDRRAARSGGRDPRRDLRRLPPLRDDELMLGALFSTPRAEPDHLLPAAGGTVVLALLLPVVALARLEHRRLGARRAAVARPPRARPPASSERARSQAAPRTPGIQAFALFFKLIALLVVLFAALAADRDVALAAGADVRARLHVRARPLARFLLRNAVRCDEAPHPRSSSRRSRCSRRKRRSRAGTSTRRPSSSSTSGSRSTSARSTSRSRRPSST